MAEDADEEKVIIAPRRSVAVRVLAVLLFLVSAGLLMYAYWGWKKLI